MAHLTLATPRPRAALIFSGHLRSTCTDANGTAGIRLQASLCRAAFDGRCDIYLHTWTSLEKHFNRSSERCFRTILASLRREERDGLVRGQVDEPPPPWTANATPWGVAHEMVDHNMWFQIEGVARALGMARHSGRQHSALAQRWVHT